MDGVLILSLASNISYRHRNVFQNSANALPKKMKHVLWLKNPKYYVYFEPYGLLQILPAGGHAAKYLLNNVWET